MTLKYFKSQECQTLSAVVTASILSTGLVLSACSNTDSTRVESAAETTTNTKEAAAVVEDSENDAAVQVKTVDDDAKKEQIADDTHADVVKNETTISNDNINPITHTDKQPSLVTNATQPNTPEAALKQAVDALYYGDAKTAATYYKVDIANFEQALADTQAAFQQTVESITITDTKYNDDNTRATITGELKLKGQSQPAPLNYELQKMDGKWKILG
ncbi:hypothetical protein J3492_06650 [Psychrobacter sp. F1192]|uniref:DUF4878 domain-containing protein n=1 Tax=Psychrobacter coccoides TaxID=2818440 RepID=A0ABS3NP70_9GAMM|nr:hypothetical protein [Psychrobacter coccoides]MBO1530893.1 hypothetical protein [Psychrobacter coccoides]